MYPAGYILQHDAEFDNVILTMTPIEVYRNGELIDYGVILRHSDFAVRLAPDDRGFVKPSHEFRVTTLDEIRKHQAN